MTFPWQKHDLCLARWSRRAVRMVGQKLKGLCSKGRGSFFRSCPQFSCPGSKRWGLVGVLGGLSDISGFFFFFAQPRA